jgi:CRP/FNR family transcriptional regulator, cyclic AMP receptor protein
MTGTTFDVEVIAAGEDRVLAFPARAVIFRQNDMADSAYIIKRGQVEIRDRGNAVETIAPGEIFGEMALIDDEPRSASAVATSDVELIPIDRSMFEVLLRDDEDFALTVMRLMARRLRATTKMLEGYMDESQARADAARQPSRASA